MNFTLRPWSLNDLDSLVKHGNNYNIARFMTDQFPHPYTPENARAFIEFAMKGNPIHIMAIEVEGQAVGGIGIHPQHDIYRKNAEMGYWLAEPYWGKGIVTRAITRMADYAFHHFEIDRIYARPFGTNLASQRALQKAGFVEEARFEKTIFKNGEYLDELVFALRRKESF